MHSGDQLCSSNSNSHVYANRNGSWCLQRHVDGLLIHIRRIIFPREPNSVLPLRTHGDPSNEFDVLHRLEDFERELGVDIRVDETVLAFRKADPHVPSRRWALVEDLQSPVTAPELDEVRPQVGPPVCERLLFLTCEQALVQELLALNERLLPVVEADGLPCCIDGQKEGETRNDVANQDALLTP